MGPVPVVIIEKDSLARDALHLYLAKDNRTSVAWSGNLAEFLTDTNSVLSFSDEKLVILLGQQWGDSIINAIISVRDRYPTSVILPLMYEIDRAGFLAIVQAGAQGCLLRGQLFHAAASAAVEAAAGRFVVTSMPAELALGRSFDLQGRQPEILYVSDRLNSVPSLLRETLLLFCIFGLSKDEVASELKISANTVASRLKAAYVTLSVGSRSEAFAALVALDTSKR